MSTKTAIPLAMVLALALTGCSDRSSDRGGQGGAPRTTAPSPSSPTATTTALSIIDADCQAVSTDAQTQLLATGLAISNWKKKQEDSVLRANVAKTYQDFADHLSLIAAKALGNLRPALTEWASASTAVARFIAEKKPRAGLLIDYGPTEKRWDAAKKAAEKICGHGLPDLDQ